MSGRLAFLIPEMALFAATCFVMVLGLSKSYAIRRATIVVAGLGLLAAGVLAAWTTPGRGEVLAEWGTSGQLLLPDMVAYAKVLIAIVGLLMLPLMAGTVDRREEAEVASGVRAYDPLRTNRAEFYAFYLFSLTGLMLVASADDLIWLFLALELTSLPTYIMVAISSARTRAREAAVKYFFLGALGAAIFLYGFTLIYGGAGSTNLNEIAHHIRTEGLDSLTLAGMLLAVLGMGFKIAAVPMHFYTADVYQGAAPQVSAFLAFVPKAAGFLGLLLLLATVGWSYGPAAAVGAGVEAGVTRLPGGGEDLPEVLRITLWIMAALTMTVGNVLAILQTSVKRVLAYSSIAHSGYMIVGLVAGPGQGTFASSGLSAVLFYLLCYGVMNIGTFAVLAALERGVGRDGEPVEVESFDDLRGLWRINPGLTAVMCVCSLSLLGLPPLLGFFGKLPLFTSAISAGEIPLLVVLALNSAIAAFYYLRLAFVPFLEDADVRDSGVTTSPVRARLVAGALSAGGVVLLAVLSQFVTVQARLAASYDGGDQAARAVTQRPLPVVSPIPATPAPVDPRPTPPSDAVRE